MDTLIVIIFFALVAAGIWIGYEQNKAANSKADKIVCPHCQTAGQVEVYLMQRKKGISGGKATGALMTGGISMFATGLSRKENVRNLRCGNCGVTWDV